MNDNTREASGDSAVVVVAAASASMSPMQHRALRRTRSQRNAAGVLALVVVSSMLSVVVLAEAVVTRGVTLRGSQGQGPKSREEESGGGRLQRGRGRHLVPTTQEEVSLSAPSSPSPSYKLVQGHTVSYAFTDRYQCHSGLNQPIPRLPLPDPIRTAPGLVDFFPRWTGRSRKNSNAGSSAQQHPLKVVIVGDSIAVQLSQVVDEAIEARERITVRSHLVAGRTTQECTHVSQGGSVVVAGMRLRNMLLNSTRERTETPQSSEHWNPAAIDELLRYEVDVPSPKEEAQPRKQPIGQFDAMVQRIPHGWIALQDITYDSLRENAMLASKLFGIETLVLINLPLINNVVDYEGKEGYLTLLQKRRLIRDFAARWKPPAGLRLKHVLVLELGDLVDDLLEWNAQIMGFNTSLPYQDWMLGHTLRSNDEATPRKKQQRRQRRRKTAASTRSKPSYYNHKVAHKCAVQVPGTATACVRNSITYDGMHLCMSTLGGRAVSGMACLIDCSLDLLEDDEISNRENDAQLRVCESRCNNQFMSTNPVPSSMMSQLS